MSLKCTMILGDCLEVMPTLPKNSASMCFADLPFQKTNNDWDIALPFDVFWYTAVPVCSANAAFAMAGTMPFSCDLVYSNKKMFRYDLVWTKTCATGFLHARKMPMRAHESVLLFYKKLPTYNAQKTKAKKVSTSSRSSCNLLKGNWKSAPRPDISSAVKEWKDDGLRHPISVINCSSIHKQSSMHPTQKPVALLDWLIRTYSNPGDNVLDPVSGSFTTCVSACLNGRNSVGIEKDPSYFEAGVERVKKTIADNKLDVDVEVRR